MSAEFVRTEAATARALGRIFSSLPTQVQLALLGVGVLIGLASCGVAWIDQQSYTPSPNICRVDEAARTDCLHVNRGPAQSVQTPAGWQR